MSIKALLDQPLTGIISVEGAAGTGKTRVLTDVLLRLLVETDRAVDEIGILSALPGAVEALQRQFRDRLDGLLAGGLDGDDGLARRWASRYQDRQVLRTRLEALRGNCSALRVMTFAPFCGWLLEECGWAAGVAPGIWEGIGWERSFATRVAELWRRDSLALSPLLAEYLLGENINAAGLARQIQPFVGRDLQPLTPRVENLAGLELAYQQAFVSLREHWRGGGRAVLSRVWQQTDPARPGRQVVQQRLAQMDRWLTPEQASLGVDLPLRAVTLSSGQAGEHPVLAAWDSLLAGRQALLGVYQQWLAWYRGQLLECCDELGRGRRTRGVMYSLEDRVLLLAEQLQGPRGERLAASVRRRLPALIWDDCQQGSQIQHEIIQRLYAGTGLPVVLLGDPCQSADRFGRADVFAYLEQRRRADARLRLSGSHHARAELGRMIALLFGQPSQPFAVDLKGAGPATEHQGVVPALVLEGDEEPPFRFWWLGDDDGRPWSREEAGELAALACAGEIARLLNLAQRGEARLGERALSANDIVVLVENQAQGRRVHGALLRVGAPGVRLAQEPVLHSREAEDLERVLLAAAEPWREERVLVALSTDLMGLDGQRLLALVEDIALREEYLEAFRSYHELWRRHGFMRMFRSWLAEEGVLRRVLQFRGGERRLTNLLHLSELLQATTVQAGLGPEALCRWMRNRRQGRDSDETGQLRLASDEPRVRVITGHLAQGQHFPVVFCPFAWEVAETSGVATFYHDPENGLRPQVDFGSLRIEQHRRLAAQEALGLRLRFLYLMLTRASSQLYLMWGKISGLGPSAPAWLLHRPAASSADQQTWIDYVEGLSAEQLLNDLARLMNAGEGALRIEYAPEEISSYEPLESEESEPGFRYFPGPVRGRWRNWQWRELAPQGRTGRSPVAERPSPLALAPESVPGLLRVAAVRRCDDADSLALILQQRGWGASRVAALVQPLVALLRRPRIVGRPLGALLDEAQADVPVCLSLARLAGAGQLSDAQSGLPTVGFLDDRIDWLLCIDGCYHVAFCCWDSWSSETPLLLGLDSWARLAAHVLDHHLRQRLADYQPQRHLGAVHFLFPLALHEDDPATGYWQRSAASLLEARHEG